MTDFTITDRYQEGPHSQTHILRCDSCGGIERIEDARWDEDAIEDADERHECPPMCVACGEPMPVADQAYAMLACSPCHRDDPDGTTKAIAAHIAQMGPSEVIRPLAVGVRKFDDRARARAVLGLES